LFEIEIIDLIIPLNTHPVTTSNVKIAQFIPSVAGESGAPKHVAQAEANSGINNINMDFIMICFIF